MDPTAEPGPPWPSPATFERYLPPLQAVFDGQAASSLRLPFKDSQMGRTAAGAYAEDTTLAAGCS